MKTEREYLIEGIMEALKTCQDMDLLYLIRGMLLNEEE